jgi:type II secretory pathway predicted ATPase ExeA
MAEVTRWPHQLRAVQALKAARAEGERIIILTIPTGGGKSLCICDLIDDSLCRGEKSVLYTNRRMLTEQTVCVMNRHGIKHGVRAAGWADTRV